IRYIRPPALRRGVRAAYGWLQPRLAHLGRPVALPPRLSVEYLEQIRGAVTTLRPELPIVATLPSVHRCDAYGRVHVGRGAAAAATTEWALAHGLPLVDLKDAVEENIMSENANPDGIHWGWDAHVRVADAVLAAVRTSSDV
ncbi:MAG: SGNH/GDSL hydrolase family protein, partial [Rhodococcus sp. (in: high G+C Gram-positive bacteria)]